VTRITAILHGNGRTFMITSRCLLPRIRNVASKFVEKIKPNFLLHNVFLFGNRSVYEVTWKNTVEPDRLQMKIWCMHIACWIPKTTKTHSECEKHYFSTAKMVTRTSLNVTLYVHCLSSLQLEKRRMCELGRSLL